MNWKPRWGWGMGDLDKLIEAVSRDVATRELPAPRDVKLGQHWTAICNAYNSSLDAAKALHEALLPGHGWGAGPWGARVWLYSDDPKWDGSERQEIEMVDAPSRAWLIAILKAYRAEMASGKEG